MTADHRDVVRRAFAGQAPAFEDPTRSFGDDDVLAWITAPIPGDAGDRVLEVAAGTALVGRALARRVRNVVAVDLTPEMLLAGRQAAATAGIANIAVVVGDSTCLPLPDGCVDHVVCRLALHHHEDAGGPLTEATRVCRPGGTLAVVDLVAPEGETRDVFDDLERRRDPSHTRALTADELHAAVTDAGARILRHDGRDNVLHGERWLEQTATPTADADHIRRAWEAELAGGPVTGMRPQRSDDGIELVHRWELIVAEIDG